MASAMILCVLLALKEGKRVNISEDDILNLAIITEKKQINTPSLKYLKFYIQTAFLKH